MKYAPLLLALSAASLFGCGQSDDASAPPAAPEVQPAEPAPASPPEPLAPATEVPLAEPAKPAAAPAVPADKPVAAKPVPAETAPAAKPAGEVAAVAPEPDLARGQQVYRQACAFCHDKGAAGAPKLGDAAAWGPRLALGTDALHAAALRGKGAMPAKGGNPSLADADVKAAVDYLVAQSR